jgi:hypothetical protein
MKLNIGNLSLPNKLWLVSIVSVGMIVFANSLPPSEASYTPSEEWLSTSGTGDRFQTNGADCDYYISPTGSNTASGTSESEPWATFSYALSNLNPGDTLCVMDGTYYQSLRVSISGTSSEPITIKALHDGAATIDGQNERKPAYITGDYFTIEGIVFQNSSGHVIDMEGSHNILRRISAYNAKNGDNSHIYVITGDDNLLEDCVSGGTGRYHFGIYESSNNVLRRVYGKWDSYNGISPRAVFSNYGADSNLLENCIGSDVFPNYANELEYYGVYQTREPSRSTQLPTNHNRYYGCIFYNNLQGGMVLADSTGPHTEIFNSVIFDHDRTDPFNSHATYRCMNGLAAASNQNDMRVSNCTFVNNSGTAIMYYGTEDLVNSIFMQNGTAFSGDGSHQYCDFYGNTSNGTTINSTDMTVDPGFGQNYLYVPDDSLLKGAGQDGEDIGANVIYRYIDGQLTDEPLWPWPMEERICDELGISVTWKSSDQISRTTGERCTGGYWEDLSEIYDLETPREDINRDGSVNVLDLQICVRVITKSETDPELVQRSDVNLDDIVDSADLQRILEEILRK